MLRARYVLSGSIQRSGDELRVNVQLIDAAGGHNVWAQKFDGHSENALEFQDRIAQSVVLAVILELQLTNWKVRDKSPPGTPEVRRLVNEALMKVFRNDPGLAPDCDGARREGAFDSARQRACKADALHRNHGGPCLWCAAIATQEHVERAVQLAEAAVRAVPDDEIARCILSFAFECAGRIDEAIVECRHAISLNPSYPSAHGDIAELYALRGQVSEALHEANEAIRLGAHDVIDFWRHNSMVVALFAERQRSTGARSRPQGGAGQSRASFAAPFIGPRPRPRPETSEEASRAIHHCLSQLPHLNLGNVSPWLCAALCEGPSSLQVPRDAVEGRPSEFLNPPSASGRADAHWRE